MSEVSNEGTTIIYEDAEPEVRKVRAPATTASKVWTVLSETFGHPFTRSVVYFEKAARSDKSPKNSSR
jgi:hypothetical protein